jgi:hypothetical protein
VDEQGWLTATDPQAMLQFLMGTASERKPRLFAVACCRRIWHLLCDARAQEALELAERFADGLVGEGERVAARKAAQQAAQSRAVTRRPLAPKWQRRAASAVYYATARDAGEAAANAPRLAVEALIWQAGGYTGCDSRAIREREQAAQASALRDIVANPFGPPAVVTPGWLAWNEGTIRGIAQGIYDDRAFDRMPVLADALEDAGGDGEAILRHCRQEREHIRGCWVLDLWLQKE